MYQFYFLSILLNLLVGLLLFCGWGMEPDGGTEERGEEGTIFPDEEPSGTPPEKRRRNVFALFFGNGSIAEERLFRLVIGGLSVFVAVVKLFAAVHGVPVFGDLLPALAGLAGGAAVLIGQYAEGAPEQLSLPAPLQLVFVDNRKVIGIACLCAAVLHFILPEVLFL
ncbi:MAG: hypothetical protein K2H09_07505 [Treponemataceae bacterium]|nr:hypothetical protein [Treponemataceae bacterium]